MKSILIPIALVGCVATTPPPRYVTQIGEEPIGGSSAEARVGESIYQKFDYQSQEVIKLAVGFERDYPACLGCTISMPAGAIVEPKKGAGGAIHCTRENYLQARFGPGNVVCFTAHGAKDEMIQFRAPGTLGSWSLLDPPIPFDRVPEMVGEGFKSELVYQGVANDVLRLLYREYSGNLVRPAFQQELTYTLSTDGPTEVGFRGLLLEVLEADNSGIRYRILKGL